MESTRTRCARAQIEIARILVQERWQDNTTAHDGGKAIRIALTVTNRTLTHPDTCGNLPSFFGVARDGGGSLLEARFGRRAHRVEPATDVYLGMSFTAIMPRTGGIGRF